MDKSTKNTLKTVLKMAKIAHKELKHLPISEYVHVENNVAMISDLYNLFTIPLNLPDGNYSIQSIDTWLKLDVIPTATQIDNPIEYDSYFKPVSQTPVDTIEIPLNFQTLQTAYNAAKTASATDHTRKQLSSINWRPNGTIEGTDSRRLLQVYSPCTYSIDNENIQSIILPNQHNSKFAFELIQQINPTNATIKLFIPQQENEKKQLVKGDTIRLIHIIDNQTNTIQVIKPIDGRFPSTDQVIPTSMMYNISNPLTLADIQTYTAKFVSLKQSETNQKLRINLGTKETTNVLTGETTSETFNTISFNQLQFPINPIENMKHIEVAFNESFLNDGFQAIQHIESLTYQDEYSPWMITGKIDDNLKAIYLLMPMRR